MEDFANHSESVEPVIESTEPTNTETVEPVTTQEPVTEPRGINVKYNKEDRFVPEEEVSTWVQKGLNYDKVQERATLADQYQQKLERIAKFYGYESHDEFSQAFEQAEQEKRVQEEAQKLGVDENVIREHLSPLKQQLSKYESELQTLRQQESVRQVESEVTSLKAKYPDFDQYQEKVFDMMLKGEVNSMETAYRLASYDDKIAAVAKQKEQEVLANVTRRGEKQVLPSNDGASSTQFSIANASLDDIRAISERVRRGERITF